MMRLYIVFVIIISSVFVFSIQGNAQHSVVLDSTFGVNGKVRTLIQPKGNIQMGLLSVHQDDGKILTASNFANYPVLVRYLPNGDLDGTWGQNGIVRVINNSKNLLSGVMQLDNGQIFLTYRKENSAGGFYDHEIAKFNTDGTLDLSFGNNGVVNYSVPTTPTMAYFPVASFVYDENIYLTGVYHFQSEYGFVRFDLNTGAIDSTFGNNGVLQTALGGYIGGRLSGFVTDDNKIRAYVGNRIYQCLPDFQVDVNGSFGVNGYIELPCGLHMALPSGQIHNDIGYTSALFYEQQTKITPIDTGFLITGIGFNCPSQNKKGLVVKYLENGAVDTGFANNGIFEVDFRRDTSERNYINSVRVLSNDYFLVSGGVYVGSANDTLSKVSQKFAMALFDENGNPVNSFGNQGNVYREDYFHTTDSLDWLANSFIQEDGKVVLMGFTPHYDPYDFQTHGTSGWGAIDNISINLSRYTIQGISEGGGVGLNQETKNDFNIYPNPTNSILNIQSNKPIQTISIYNYLGELVIQENGQALNQINVEQFNKGIYVIRLKGENGWIFNEKFVKE